MQSPANFSFTQIRYVLAVARLRHFGQAARDCHVSQPTLSMQIHKLEEELGVRLFDRDKKPVLPTLQGELFIEHGRRVMRAHDELWETLRVGKGEISGELRIAIIPTLLPSLLPLFLKALAAAHPKLQLRIDELKTSECLNELQNDNIDVALLAGPLGIESFFEEKLFEESFMLYCAPGEPLLSKKSIQESSLDRKKMWLLTEGHCMRNQVTELCDSRGSKNSEDSGPYPNISFEAANLDALRMIVASSTGYTLLPELYALALPTAEKKKQLRPFSGRAPAREICMLYRRSTWKRHLLDALKTSILSGLPSHYK